MTQQFHLGPSGSVLDGVDQWLNNDSPAVDEAVAALGAVRQIGRHVRIAEAHIIGYIRDRLDLDDLADDPDVVSGVAAEADP